MSDQWSNSGSDSSRVIPPAGTSGQGSQPAGKVEETKHQAKDAMAGAQQKAGEIGGKAASTAGEISNQASAKASEIGDQAASKSDAGMEKAAGGLDSLASTIRTKSESMGEGQVQSMATAAADKIESGAEMLRAKDTDQLMSELESLVRRKPVESLLIAAGIGYLLSRKL